MAKTNRLSDGFLPTWKTCPYCGSDHTRAIFGLINAGYFCGMALLYLFLLVVAVFFDWALCDGEGPAFNFKRRCRLCRGKFWPHPRPEELIACGQCGYDLTGNLSGVCPECGWTIPPEARKRIQSKGIAQPE
jgi:hypothetical protein